ncbi:hypothetical protein LIER_38869 [Lithospermum erythrorhizon]|uniref:HMA domain-containing protein n=1 Tax=Lithospermum erythrorhizon TaxID=34254 RepID=A0AAV3Q7D1_LITER
MTKDEDFMLLKIQTCVLRVNIDCDGCNHKVKKLLQRIEGVYQVSIDAEQQKVAVSGIVDPETLIKKLTRAGKPAEVWSQKPPKQNQNQNQKGGNNVKEDKSNKAQKQNMLKNLEALKNQQKFHYFCEGDEDFLDDDGEFDKDDEMLRERAENHLAMRRQQGTQADNNAKKNVQANSSGASSNNAKATNNAGKKKNQNQNILGGCGSGNGNGNPGGIDAKTLAAMQMNNIQLGGGNANPLLLQGKGPNDINAMMNLAGYHGNGANNISSVLGGSHVNNPSGGFQQAHQIQPNNPFQGPFASGYNHPSMMMNMNGYQQQQINNHPSVMMNLQNLQNRHPLQQPQMMYNISPFIPPATGYYYNYGASPDIYQGGYNSATHMFGDDNPSSCSIM